MVTWPITSCDLERSRSWHQYIWGLISRQQYKLSSAFSSIETFRSLPSSTHGQPPSTRRSTSSKTIIMEVESRKDAVLLAQIQSGHCILFKSYHHLMDPTVDPTCPRCGEEPHTVEHWLTECPGTAASRQREPPTQCSYGGTEEGVADVSAHPVGLSCQQPASDNKNNNNSWR